MPIHASFLDPDQRERVRVGVWRESSVERDIDAFQTQIREV